MEIKLTGKKGGTTLVSEEDYEELAKLNIYDNNGYARMSIGGKNMSVHTYIMKSDSNIGQIVDHINGNKLDNRRENLRVTTVKKNNENKNIFKLKKTSIYHGVFYQKNVKKFLVAVTINGNRVSLGYYENETVAAEKRDAYVIQNKASHMKLNFPDKKELYSKMDIIVPLIQSNSTGFTGVRFKEDTDKYYADITVNKIYIFLGTFDNASLAAKEYDKYIVDNNIPDRNLNYPEENLNYNPTSVIKTFFKEIDSKTIELNDKIIIDKEDYEKIKFYKICVTRGYALIYIKKTMKLSRLIMNVTDERIYIDHIDGNKLNNSKLNLRISNAQKNAQNKTTSKNNTSIYLGVCKPSKLNFKARIVKEGKILFRALNSNEEIVARYRDIYIMDYLKEDHYTTNFKWTEEEKKEWIVKFNNAVNDKTVMIY